MSTLRIWDEDGGRAVTVDREHYCKAKADALVEFGYPDVTPALVEEHLVSILADGDEEFDIVRRFIQGDLVLE